MTVRDNAIETLREVRWFLGEIRRWMAEAEAGDNTAVSYCAAQTRSAMEQLDRRFPGLTERARIAVPGDITQEKSPLVKYRAVQDREPTPCPCCRQDAYPWRVT